MEKLAYDYGLEMETPFVQKIREEGIQLGQQEFEHVLETL